MSSPTRGPSSENRGRVSAGATSPTDGPTHDWSRSVDEEHLEDVRRRADELAPGGVHHLILEVLAYAAEEAEARGGGTCRVTLHADGSVSVADDGRGTQTRVDDAGRARRKPVMATADLRLFEAPAPPLLPDGRARRGMSVVAALSEWLVHLNRRAEGSWTQEYRFGVPVTGLVPVAVDEPPGTTVRFRAGPLVPRGPAGTVDLIPARAAWPHLGIEVVDERPA